MIRIGWKNLVHDRIRLAVTLAGVTFSVVLMLVQTGIFFGYMSSVSGPIDHCEADLWLASAKTVNADTARPIAEDLVHRVRAIPGIAWAAKLTHGWAYLTLPDGAGIWAQVMGFDPATGIGGPWEVVRGRLSDLTRPGTYFVDEASLPMLRGARVESELENFDRKIEIVGVSRGAKSYNTYPILFTSIRTAQEQSVGMEGRLSFVVAKLERGADRGETLERLRSLRHFDVYTREEFSGRVRGYWATKTGIGVGIGMTVLLAFVVGVVIVGQTMYSATVERLREYATLRALGARRREICSVLWTQAAALGLAGYAAGAAVSLAAELATGNTVVAMDLTPALFALILAVTLGMCLGASLLSVLRVLRLDPAMVFRA